MKSELKEIEKILLNLGWIQSNSPSPDDDIMDTTEFVKSYYGNTIGIEVALEDFSLDCYGRYGVCSVYIVKYDQSFPYLRDDIKRMQNLIQDVEIELITNDVPFRPTYAFIKNTEHYIGVNLDLRDKYNLDEYEKEWRNA